MIDDDLITTGGRIFKVRASHPDVPDYLDGQIVCGK